MAPLGIVITLMLAVTAESGVTARATLDLPVIPFHRSVRYVVTVDAPEDATVTLPTALEKVEGLEIKAEAPVDESIGQGRRLTKTFVIDPIHAGHYLLPAIKIGYGEGLEQILPPLTFLARELSPEELEAVARFEMITGPDALLQRRVSPVWFVLGAVCIAALLAGAWALHRMRQRTAAESAPPPPAWESALRRLDELESRRLPESGRFEPYYVDLSAILRYYIEDRFGLRAPEQTTPEFLDAASRSGLLLAAQQEFLADFLRLCDRVKFARYVPETQEMDAGMAAVRQFVRDTIPRQEEALAPEPEKVSEPSEESSAELALEAPEPDAPFEGEGNKEEPR